MGFPAKTEDGETVIIVEKGNQGNVVLMRAANGDCYIPSPTNPRILIPHEGNATEEKLLEAAQAEAGEPTIEVETPEGEKLITPIEQFENLINESADRQDVSVEELAQKAAEADVEAGGGVEAAQLGAEVIVSGTFEAGEGETGAEEGNETPEAA